MHAPGHLDIASGPDDAQLVRQAQGGDHASLGLLLRRHERRLLNVALGILGHRADAQDATQDAFVSIVRRLGDFRGDAAVTTWMTRVVINASKDLLRKRKRRPATAFSALNGHRAAGDPAQSRFEEQLQQSRELPPDADVESREQRQRLREAVAALDEPFRDVLVLRDLDGMDYADIAATLELPLGTVKSRLFRARLMLRDALRKESATVTQATASPQRS